MVIDRRTSVIPAVIAIGLLTGCGGPPPLAPTAASQVASPRPPTPVVFTEAATAFSTSDLRDVDGQLLQVNTAGEVVWMADGTRIPGFGVAAQPTDGVVLYFISGDICQEGCAFEVRFGTKDGERGAYLTADYGHENPGTLVDVEVVGGRLVVTRTDVFPPGAPTLSGVVFEVTPAGRSSVGGARVSIAISSGWRSAITDANGFYFIPGLFDVGGPVRTSRGEDYMPQAASVVISGDTVLDIGLVRR